MMRMPFFFWAMTEGWGVGNPVVSRSGAGTLRQGRAPKMLAAAFACVLALSFFSSAAAQMAHHGAASMEHLPRFQNAERWARVFESPKRAKWQKPDEVVRALGLKPGQTVVDIGAGTGYFTRRFAAAVAPNGTAVGVDVEPGMVEYMKGDAKKRRLTNYKAHLGKPDDPELTARSADLIFFCDVLHHVNHRVAYFKKLRSALKPGGRIAVIDFKKKPLPVGPPEKFKIPREEMIKEFRSAGYRLVREHRFLPYQYFLEFEPLSSS